MPDPTILNGAPPSMPRMATSKLVLAISSDPPVMAWAEVVTLPTYVVSSCTPSRAKKPFSVAMYCGQLVALLEISPNRIRFSPLAPALATVLPLATALGLAAALAGPATLDAGTAEGAAEPPQAASKLLNASSSDIRPSGLLLPGVRGRRPRARAGGWAAPQGLPPRSGVLAPSAGGKRKPMSAAYDATGMKDHVYNHLAKTLEGYGTTCVFGMRVYPEMDRSRIRHINMHHESAGGLM